MAPQTEQSPILVFSYGNPSRGDDALGPALNALLEKNQQATNSPDRVELLTDYQLQIEHAIDLEQRECVVFIDASVCCTPPYEFQLLQAQRDSSYTSHAMSPAAVLAVYRQINQSPPPPCYLLTIRGYEFDLGRDISEQAAGNLQQAFAFITKLLAGDTKHWPAIPAVSNS